jgi:hypothetical protein
VLVGFYQGYQPRRTVSATEIASKAAEDAATVAEKSLVLTQRPKLRSRNIVIEDEKFNGNGSLFIENKLVSGQLYVVNVGNTPAT